MTTHFMLTCPSGHRTKVAPSRVTWVDRCMYCGSDVTRERVNEPEEGGCRQPAQGVVLHDHPWHFGSEPALHELVRHLQP